MNEVCARFRELVSARVDEEITEIDAARLDRHLMTCVDCAAYDNQVWSLRRSFAITAAPEPGGQTPTGPAINIADAIGSTRSTRTHQLLRWALFVIGATLVIVHGRHLLFWGAEAVAHGERHGSVFGVALGLAMVVVSGRPHRAIGLVPLTSSAALLMGIVVLADLANGSASILGEALHLFEFAGLVCLWVISGGPTRARRYAAAVTQRIGLARTPARVGC